MCDYLADNLAGKPVLCVATLRDAEPSAGLEALRAIHARRAASLVAVPRLTAREVSRWRRAAWATDAVPPALVEQAAR